MGSLSDIQIRHWVKAGVPVAKTDGDCLTFTLSKGGTAAWVLRYRMGGKQREMTIGRWPDISLKRARELATEERVKIQQGVDVAREKQREKHKAVLAWTVRQLATDYENIVLPTHATNTQINFKQVIRDYILPVIGHLPARDVTGAEIVQLLQRAAGKSALRVKPALSVSNLVFKHGIAKHVVIANPCAGISATAIVQQPKPDARLMLSDAELKAVLGVLGGYGRINDLVVRILLSTAVRIGALILAEAGHINFSKREWFIPALDGRKSSRDFVVPLTETVAGYFHELLTFAGSSKYVLPIQKRMAGGREGDVPMAKATINQVLKRLCESLGGKCRPFSPHDIRSTCRSHLTAMGVNIIIAERCLNHSLGGLVAVYDQHDYLDERRRALELWESKLATLESDGDNVVMLRGVA
jgi:integrase